MTHPKPKVLRHATEKNTDRWLVVTVLIIFDIQNSAENYFFVKKMFERLKLSFGIIFFYGLLGVAQEKITKADYGEEKVTVFRVKNFFLVI